MRDVGAQLATSSQTAAKRANAPAGNLAMSALSGFRRDGGGSGARNHVFVLPSESDRSA